MAMDFKLCMPDMCGQKEVLDELKEERMANELNEKKIKQLQNQPIIETSVYRSKDGKWLIHKTTITDIRPVNVYEKVIEHAGGPSN